MLRQPSEVLSACVAQEDGRLTCPSHLHLVSGERSAAPEPDSDLAPDRFAMITVCHSFSWHQNRLDSAT